MSQIQELIDASGYMRLQRKLFNDLLVAAHLSEAEIAKTMEILEVHFKAGEAHFASLIEQYMNPDDIAAYLEMLDEYSPVLRRFESLTEHMKSWWGSRQQQLSYELERVIG